MEPNNHYRQSALTIIPGSLERDLQVSVPGSKSITNRILLISAFADGISHIQGFLESDDTRKGIECLRALGFNVRILNKDSLEITGVAGKIPVQNSKLYLGAAGTLARFLPGLLAVSPTAGKWQLAGDHTLTRRPQKELLESLATLGARINYLEHRNFLPIEVEGDSLRGGRAFIDGSRSSQFISGLLMACSLAKEASVVEATGHLVQPEYIDITCDILEKFGAEITRQHHTWQISPVKYTARDITVEADVSSAAYFFALAAIHGISVTVTNMPENTLQPDRKILGALKQMGCEIKQQSSQTTVTGPKMLRGGFSLDLNDYSDQALTLGVMGALCDAPLELSGISHIRFHESNRIDCLAKNLAQIGIRTQKTNSGIIIFPGMISSGVIDPEDDHRVAMSFSILASKSGPLTITNPNCTSKTFPTFFEKLGQLGVKIEGNLT